MEPIRHVVSVASPAVDAFAVFTAAMGSWWDPLYSPDPDAFTGVEVEPRVGGTVALVLGADRYAFGTVTTWEPGVRYGQTFWLAMDPAYPSTLDVAFEDAEDAAGVCEITFEHGGWYAENGAARAGYGDWPHLLGRFAAACASRE